MHGWMDESQQAEGEPSKTFVMLIGMKQSFHAQRIKVVVDQRSPAQQLYLLGTAYQV